MRKSFDGLTGVLHEFSIANLNAQFLYIFANKRRNRVKLLYFDRTGVYVVAKRLEQGTFSWPPPRKKNEHVIPLAAEALQLLLDGVDLRGAQLREWYRAENWLFSNKFFFFCYNVRIENKETELLKEENQRLKTQVAWLKQQLFGSKSERLDPSQKELFEQDPTMGKPEPPLDCEKTSVPEEANSKNPRKRRTKAELFPRNLPIFIKETLIPEEVQNNPDAFELMATRHHDELDFQPARLQWQRTLIPTFKSIKNKAELPIREYSPESKIPGTMITPALATALIIDKHCDHLPHYRQSQRFFREQTAEISRKTINSWVHHTANHLTPIAQAIGKELRHSELLQIDETPMHYLIPGTGKAHTGYLWVMRDPHSGAVYYQWQKGRSAKHLTDTLGYDEKTKELSFKGIIQCDGYICYETVMNTYQGIRLGACLAHIRRKFLDDKSLKNHTWVASLLRSIRVLYRIERRLRNTSAPPDLCRARRQTYAKPIVENLHKLLKEQLPQHRPASSAGRAIKYALNQWDQFSLYLEQGRLPIDNNGVENSIRPCKLGMKNYMFFGSLEAGNNNAVLYTLIENCKAQGLNPRDYLEYVLENYGNTPAANLTPAKVAKNWEIDTKSA